MRPLLVVTTMACVTAISGCGMNEGLIAMRDRAADVRERIRADREALEASAAALPESDPARARIEALIADRAAQSVAYTRAIERFDALVEQASRDGADPAAAVEQGIGLLAPFLPPGSRLPALLAGGLAASLWRARRLRQAGLSIAESLDKAMRDDEGLKEGMRRNATTLRAIQTPAARRLVDAATKPRAAPRPSL
jgi:hypothetical protein